MGLEAPPVLPIQKDQKYVMCVADGGEHLAVHPVLPRQRRMEGPGLRLVGAVHQGVEAALGDAVSACVREATLNPI